MGFTDQFTNVLISPVNKRYRLITLTASTDLVWPIESATSDNTLLEWMDVTANANTWSVNFPDATGGGEGFSTIVVNTGADSFTVKDSIGGVIQVIAAGEAWLIWLKDNTTVAGSWQSLQIGSTTSEASAATLAGQGLYVIGLTLNQSHPVWNITGDYSVIPSIDRSRLLLWTGGSGTITFDMTSLPDNWFTLIANQGSAAITLSPIGADIDGASTKTLNIGESCFVVSNGTDLYTVGYGRSSSYTETYLNLSVAGSSDVTLTSTQFSSNIIRVFGALTGNISVIVPAAVHEFIFYNNTSGAFSITVLVNGETGVAVAQGESSVLYCNGTDVFPGNTSSTVTNVQFGNGTVSAPSITFQSDNDTGFFRANTNTIGVAAGGVLNSLLNTVASGINAFAFTPGATGVAPVLGTFSGTDTNVGLTITPQGIGVITLTNAVTASSTLGVTGNLAVATNKFTVAAASGNTLVAGTLGVTGALTAASFNKLTITAPATGSTLTVADGKTATISNTLTLTGTDGSSVAFGTGGTVIYGNQTVTLSGDVTGSGATAITTTVAKIAGTTVSGTTGTTNVVFSSGPTLVAPILGTPASGTLTHCTGVPISTGVSGLGSGVSTFLASSTASNLIAIVSGTTGTDALVFASGPTLVAAVLGSSTATTQSAGDNSTKVATTAYSDVKTALAVGAYLLATNNSGGTITANSTTAGSNVIVATSGGTATTDSVSGTVKAMQRLTNGQTGLWLRVA